MEIKTCEECFAYFVGSYCHCHSTNNIKKEYFDAPFEGEEDRGIDSLDNIKLILMIHKFSRKRSPQVFYLIYST